MIETFAFITFRQPFPVYLGSLQQRKRSHHICPCKGKRILDTAVYMTFRSQVDNSINMILLHQFQHLFIITDVCLDESIVFLVLNILQVGQVARIGQLVQIDDMILRIFVHEKSYHMAADKSGTTGDQDVAFEIHNIILRIIHLLIFILTIQVFRESIQYGIFNPKACLIFVLSSTE